MSISWKRKGSALVASALCVDLGVGAAGCSASPNATSGADAPNVSGNGNTANKKDTSTLVFATADYATINPILNTHEELPDIIFSGLMTYDGAGQPIKDMAQDYTYDAATLTYTFKIRDGVKFHDGQPCTAEDVKFTLDTLTQNKDLSASITDNYKEIQAVTVVDPLTVEIKLSQESAAMLDYLTIGILPKHLLEGKDIMTDSFNQHPVGTGRYQFINWDQGQSVTVEKNTDFYGKVPNIETIVMKIVPDENAKALQIKSGELDMAWLNAQNTETFRSDPNYTVYDFTTADYRAIAPNFDRPFWKENKGLVAALSYALDKEAIINSVLTGQGQMAYSPIQLDKNYNNPNVEHYDYNPDKFKEEVEQLGWIMGSDGIYEKGGQKLSFSVDAREYEEERVDIANIASQQLKKVGVDMKVHLVSKLDWNALEGFLVGQASPFDPDNGTYTLFATGASGNYTHYSNADVDKYLKEARTTTDPDKRKEAYNKFQEALAKDPAYIMIAYLDGNYVSIPGLKGPSTERILGHHAVGVMWNVEDWTLE